MTAEHSNQHPFLWKAAAPSLALSAVLLAVTVCATSVLLVNYRASDEAIRQAMEGLDAAVEFELGVADMRRTLAGYLTSGDEQLLDEVHQQREAAVLRLLRVERTTIGHDGKIVTSQIWGVLGDLDQALERYREAAQQLNAAQAAQIVDRIINPNVLAGFREQREITQAALESARSDSRQLTNIAVAMLLVLGLSGAGVGIYAAYNRARTLQQQMVELTVSVNSATGSLDDVCERLEPVAIEPSGDLSQVQSMVDLLVERVSGVVGRLQEAERESIRRDQLASLGQLAAGLAHELRNPLTAIKTLVEAARGSGADGKLDDRDLQVIEEELSRLDTTLQSFLDYARPPKSARREIDVRQLIQNTLHLLSSQMERLSIRVENVLPAEPVRAQADPEQLKQVLLNLFLNAVDAMGKGGTLTVTLKELPAGIEIDVEDTGPGISSELRDRLFEPFVSSKPGGTGLGLTISRRIVEAHGGTVVADNRPRGGARFRITLPGIPAAGFPDAASSGGSAVSKSPASQYELNTSRT